MLLYPGLTLLDLLSPHTSSPTQKWDILLVWKNRDPIVTDRGSPCTRRRASLTARRTSTFSSSQVGGIRQHRRDEEVLAFLGSVDRVLVMSPLSAVARSFSAPPAYCRVYRAATTLDRP